MASGGNPFDFSQYNGGDGNTAAPPLRDVALGSAPTGFETGDVHGFGNAQPSSSSGSLTVVSAPLLWIFIAAGCAVVGIILGLVTGGVPAMAIAGWAVGGPIAIALLAVFSLKDTQARASAMYSSSSLASQLYWGVLLLSMAAVLIGALHIANWIGRI